VLANGSMSSNQSGEGEIRRAIIEADLVDCMVALPGQLFYSTQIPACLWFLARDRRNGRFRDRRGETLFIDARKMGVLIDRVHRELTTEEIAKIAGTYHAWRATLELELMRMCRDFARAPRSRRSGRTAMCSHLGDMWERRRRRTTVKLAEQFRESARLEAEIWANLKGLGYEI